MAVELVIAPEAERDLDEAYAWYERQRVGLGEEFFSCVDARIHSVCRAPDLGDPVIGDYRRALTRRFPYAVFYEHVAGVVTVYGVFHVSRDPEKWRERLA